MKSMSRAISLRAIVFFATVFSMGFINAAELKLARAESGECEKGQAAGFACQNVDLISRVDLLKSGIRSTVSGNDCWGWTDPETGHEIAIMGLSNKTSFVDITDAAHPIHLADLPTHTVSSIWRDIKVYNNHAYIVSEAMGHGLQVFDLTQLRELTKLDKPMVVQESAHYNLFGSAHNIAINEDTGFGYAVGSTTCDAGLHVVDLRNPKKPRFSTCVDRKIFEQGDVRIPAKRGPLPMSMGPMDSTYTHDVQCVVYHGPDHRFHGREICFAANDDTINIVDVTDKAAPLQLSVLRYEQVGFVHQGWLTEDQRFWLANDELDEIFYKHNTQTRVIDVSDLKKPFVQSVFTHSNSAIDHNLYVKGRYVYEANYASGLRILDLFDISAGHLSEAGFFDTVSENNNPEFIGAWSVYPFFKSGNVICSVNTHFSF